MQSIMRCHLVFACQPLNSNFQLLSIGLGFIGIIAQTGIYPWGNNLEHHRKCCTHQQSSSPSRAPRGAEQLLVDAIPPPIPKHPWDTGMQQQGHRGAGSLQEQMLLTPSISLMGWDNVSDAFPTFLQLCLRWAVSRQSWQLALNFKMKLWGSSLNAEVFLWVLVKEIRVFQFQLHGIEGEMRGIKMAFLCFTLHLFWWWSAQLSRRFRNKNVI